MTNRDLYEFVVDLRAGLDQPRCRDLETYLRALWGVARDHASTDPSAEHVRDWLESALTADVPDYDERWAELAEPEIEDDGGYEDWERLIQFQIADLRRMRDSGQLADEHRYYGVVSPSGADWYNFDVGTYLECAVQGSVGGYPGCSGEGGDEEVALDTFGWALFAYFLYCGATYE